MHSHKLHPLVGVLCGSCPQGCGVSVLTNRCVTCGNENGLLILALCKPMYLQVLSLANITDLHLTSIYMFLSRCGGCHGNHCHHDLPPSTNGRVLSMSLCHSSEPPYGNVCVCHMTVM